MKTAENQLRHFTSLDDLFDTCEDTTILAWVNELAKVKIQQRNGWRRRQLRDKAFVEIAKELLEADEVAKVMEDVEERMEEMA